MSENEKTAIRLSTETVKAACEKDCASEPATDVRIELANRCLATGDCTALSKCLTDLARELRN
jgi:hypothetical protein